MRVVRLLDRHVRVHRFDPRDRLKQELAGDVRRRGPAEDVAVLPQRAIVESVAAVARPRSGLGGQPLFSRADAFGEGETMLSTHRALHPTGEPLATTVRGGATYRSSGFDADLWAFAEVLGIPEILSEDFEHGRHYGRVRVMDRFRTALGQVQELPPLYAT